MWEKNKSNYKIKPWVNCVSVNNTINSLCLFEVHAWLIAPVCLLSPLSHQVFGTWGKCTQLIMTLHSAVYLCVWSKVEKYNQRDVMWFESLWTVAHAERWSYVSVEIASKPLKLEDEYIYYAYIGANSDWHFRCTCVGIPFPVWLCPSLSSWARHHVLSGLRRKLKPSIKNV